MHHERTMALGGDEGLAAAARIAVKDVLGTRAGERVLIVTNPSPDVLDISGALYNAFESAGGLPVMMVQPPKTQLDFTEDSVLAAIRSEPEIILSISDGKIGKDKTAIREPYIVNGKKIDTAYHYLLSTRRTRGFWSPGITRELFRRTVPIDYSRLREISGRLKMLLDSAGSIRIRSEAGTDILVPVAGRKASVDDGDFRAPGTGGNLPAGEVFISPVVAGAEGHIVFDGSITLYSGDILLDGSPISVMVESGYITEVHGDDNAGLLLETFRKAEENTRDYEKRGILSPGQGEVYRRNIMHLGEFGIGLNPEAFICGNMLVDEKASGTCHIAVGSNYDDDAPALIHLDGLIRSPTVTLNFQGGGETVLMEKGVLLTDPPAG